MNGLIRVLIVDDSPFVCRLLSSHLNSAENIQVIGTADNGSYALKLVRELRPDVVTMDQEMPQMDGLESLERIMHECPTPVVMISGVSRRAAKLTRQALSIGAVDFVLKYSVGNDTNPDALRREIIAKVQAAARIQVIRSIRSERDVPSNISELLQAMVDQHQPSTRSVQRRRKHVEQMPPPIVQTHAPALFPRGVIVVGASTGGPIALRELLEPLSAHFPTPIVVVQHIPATFTDILAQQLNRQVALHVKEAVHGEKLVAGIVYVAPGNQHLLFSNDGRIKLNQGPRIKGHRPAIDVTMQSAAQLYGAHTRGVVLTGMGDDGTLGLVSIQAKGGKTYAQEAASCVVDGMPQRAIEKGVVDWVGVPAEIGRYLSPRLKP